MFEIESIEQPKRGWNNALRKGKSKIHRHNKPKIFPVTCTCKGMRRLAIKLSKHCFQKNGYLINKRREKNMRINIRSEREQSYESFSMIALKYLDLDLFGCGLFEVKCSLEFIAKQMNIYYETASRKKHYDILHNVINDFEEAGLIIVYRSFDKENKVYKASRIWFTPEFFYGIGYTATTLREIILSRAKYLKKHKKTAIVKENYNNYLLKMERYGILDLSTSLVNLLIKIKRKLMGHLIDAAMINETEHRKNSDKQKLQQKALKFEYKNMSAQDEFMYKSVDLNLSPIDVYKLQKRVKQEYPNLSNNEYWLQCLIELDLR